jgi:DNA mismatch endonuclease (patch repair protein)
MGAVRNKNSRAELALRRALHAGGLRYRLHAKDVIGRPDIVIRARRLAVFVDGDLWHGNAWRVRGLDCLDDLFPSRTDWWVAKIRRNVERDTRVNATLEAAGWTVVRLWESDILANPAVAAAKVATALRRAGRQSRTQRKTEGLPL